MVASISFFGAGASTVFGIPAMAQMAQDFENKVKSDYPQGLLLLEDIKWRLQQYESFDLEALITVLQDIIAKEPARVLSHPSVHYFSVWDHGFEAMTKYAAENASRNEESAE